MNYKHNRFWVAVATGLHPRNPDGPKTLALLTKSTSTGLNADVCRMHHAYQPP